MPPDDPDDPIDYEAVDAQITDGARAFRQLLDHAANDWTHWEITIRGLRALRTLAFAKGSTNDMHSQAYRDAMRALLQQQRSAVYNQIDKQTRSDCYKLMDCLEQISIWYSTLPASNKLRWKHPSSIAKHCPKNLMMGPRPNQKKKGAKKPIVDAEIERLRVLLQEAIKLLIKHEPTHAQRLLGQVMPADPDDSLDGI
jgi:hypothetical protein